MEKLDEMYNMAGAFYSTYFRGYDPRLGRWISPDPVFQPWQSPYAAMDNNPMNMIDPNGDYAIGAIISSIISKSAIAAKIGSIIGWLKTALTAIKGVFTGGGTAPVAAATTETAYAVTLNTFTLTSSASSSAAVSAATIAEGMALTFTYAAPAVSTFAAISAMPSISASSVPSANVSQGLRMPDVGSESVNSLGGGKNTFGDHYTGKWNPIGYSLKPKNARDAISMEHDKYYDAFGASGPNGVITKGNVLLGDAKFVKQQYKLGYFLVKKGMQMPGGTGITFYKEGLKSFAAGSTIGIMTIPKLIFDNPFIVNPYFFD